LAPAIQWGPLELCDFIGLDVLQAVCESIFNQFRRDRVRAATADEAHDRNGPFGPENRQGFYRLHPLAQSAASAVWAQNPDSASHEPHSTSIP
jgi:3-hydroxyacyl-CoA dehydrogenase